MGTADERFHEAEEAFRSGESVRAEEILRELVGNGPCMTEACGRAGYALCVRLYTTGRADEARTILPSVLTFFQKSYGDDSPVVLRIMTLLARCHIAMDDFDSGLPMARDVVDRLARTREPNDADLAAACFFLSSAEYQVGRLDEAERLTRRAMSIFKELGGREADISTCLNNLGRICEERGETEQGIAYHRESVTLHRKTFGKHPQTAFALGNLGVALASAGYFAEAVSTLEECLQVYAEAGISTGREVEGYRKNLEICRRALAEL